MAQALDFTCDQHADVFDCPDALVVRTSSGGIGFIVHDGGSSFVEISHCPWCAASLGGTSVGRVFLVQHERTEGSDTDLKLVGVYSARETAEAAVARLSLQPGFRDHPDGFSIDAYPLNADHWKEGFGS